MDALDAIMHVMDCAFDPAFGEAWNRRQVSDALTVPNTRFLLADIHGREPENLEDTVGFTLSRTILDEEELLLIAVKPQSRGHGVGKALMKHFIDTASNRGVIKLFLEMRDGNPAEQIYREHGFRPIGRRTNYYRSGNSAPIDAITFSRLTN